MKKNLLLVATFCSLVFIAFFIEERVKVEAFQENLKKDRVLKDKFDQLTKIHFPQLSLTKKNTWQIEEINYPASETFLKSLEENLLSIKKIKELKFTQESLENYFQFQDHHFKITTPQEEISFRLGDVNQITGYFYLLKSKGADSKLYLCELDKLLTTAYSDEIQKRMVNYIVFKNLILSKPGGALKQGFSHLIDFSKAIEFHFSPKTFRDYIVLDSGIKAPLPPSGIKVVENVFKDLEELMKILTPTEVIRTTELAINLISKIEVKGEEKITFELFQTYKGQNAPFLKISKYPEFLFVLEDKNLNLFYLSHQDFWNKKIHFDKDFSQLKEIKFSLSFPSEKITEKFIIKDFESFQVIPLNEKLIINPKVFNLLFNILFGTSEFKQARALGSPSELELNSTDFEVEITLFERKFKTVIKDKNIFIIDRDNNYYLMYDYDLRDLKPTSSKNFFKES